MDKHASVMFPIAAISEKRVTWLELFYDLLFVAAVAKASHVLLHMEHGIIPSEYLGKFVLILVPIWWAGQIFFYEFTSTRPSYATAETKSTVA